jgi:hypothetical protein
MKKYILLLLCTVAISISSCKKETLITEPVNRTILFDIRPNDWVLSGNGLGYYKDVAVPENNDSFNRSGHVVVSMSFDDPLVYEGLPQVYQGVTYRYSAEPGFVTLYVGNANGTAAGRPSGTVTAKITLIDGQLID